MRSHVERVVLLDNSDTFRDHEWLCFRTPWILTVLPHVPLAVVTLLDHVADVDDDPEVRIRAEAGVQLDAGIVPWLGDASAAPVGHRNDVLVCDLSKIAHHQSAFQTWNEPL